MLCGLLLVGSLILTLAAPRLRIWPPPERRSWQYRYTWGLAILSLIGLVTLGILDWNRFWFGHWIRFVVGGVLVTGGLAFACWGLRSLGIHQSLGLEGRLVTTGAYGYSRNPEYVGDIACLLGFALVCNSGLTFIAAGVGILWFLLAPVVEEPWLRERFGSDYEAYLRRVPRFLSPPRRTPPALQGIENKAFSSGSSRSGGASQLCKDARRGY
jgi:protein-S-isoprenylcysteine O-methyltransferase Ste14